MNEREAQAFLDFLTKNGVANLELEQTGGDVYAVISSFLGGTNVYVQLKGGVGIHFYPETDWQDGEDSSSFVEVHIS